jgi:hypothetical protein
MANRFSQLFRRNNHSKHPLPLQIQIPLKKEFNPQDLVNTLSPRKKYQKPLTIRNKQTPLPKIYSTEATNHTKRNFTLNNLMCQDKRINLQ